ncbi:MAG: hypothetical protein A2147_00170, partial [Chloroflexi bacterium RBG_16_57_8]
MGRILVGISSWSEPAFVDSGFYPAEVKTAAQRLVYYASRFPVAEIDSTFHFFATTNNLKLWLDNTPDGFSFNVKAYSLFTLHPTPFSSLPKGFRETYAGKLPAKATLYLHHLPEDAADDLWQGFARTAGTFRAAGKLGAVLFQFPPYFHPSEESLKHIEICRNRLPEYPLAVEFRVGSWLNDEHRKETLAFLRKLDIALVCVDEPQGFKSSVPPEAEITASLALVRFHGRNQDNWEKKGVMSTDRFNYLYNREELQEWVPRIKRMANQAEKVHVIFKNKHADYPAQNA